MLTRADYIADFRQANPDYSNWTDDDILQFHVEQLGDRLDKHPALQEFVQQRRSADTNFFQEGKRALAAGVDQFQGKLYDTAALAGRVSGSQTLEDWGREGANTNADEAAEYQPVVAEFEKVRTARDFGMWLANIMGTNAPQMAGTMAAGVAASALAPEAAIAGISAKALAAFAGGSTMGFSQMQNFGELEKMGGDNTVPLAVANGLLGAALEAAGPASIIAKLTGSGVKRELAEKAVKETLFRVAPGPMVNAALEAAKHGSTEMLTEMAQEALTITSEAISKRNDPNWKLDDNQIRSRLLNSGVAGFVLGGVAGGLTGAITSGENSPTDPNAGKTIPDKSLTTKQVSLDPVLPEVQSWEIKNAQERESRLAPVTAPVEAAPAAAPAAPVAPTPLATPEVQQQLVAIGVDPTSAATMPADRAQVLLIQAQQAAARQQAEQTARAQAEAAAKARAEQEQQIAFQAEMQAQLAAEQAAQIEADRRLEEEALLAQKQALAAQRAGDAEAAAAARARAQQLLAQRKGFRAEQAAQRRALPAILPKPIAKAMREAPDPTAPVTQVLPGPTIFNQAHLAQEDSATAMNEMADAQYGPAWLKDLRRVKAVAPNADLGLAPEITGTKPVRTRPAAPAPQPGPTTAPAPTSVPTTPAEIPGEPHGSKPIHWFETAREGQTLESLLGGKPNDPSERWAVYTRPDGMVEIHQVSQRGKLRFAKGDPNRTTHEKLIEMGFKLQSGFKTTAGSGLKNSQVMAPADFEAAFVNARSQAAAAPKTAKVGGKKIVSETVISKMASLLTPEVMAEIEAIGASGRETAQQEINARKRELYLAAREAGTAEERSANVTEDRISTAFTAALKKLETERAAAAPVVPPPAAPAAPVAPPPAAPVAKPPSVTPTEPTSTPASSVPTRPPQQEVAPSLKKLNYYAQQLDQPPSMLTESKLTEFTAKYLLKDADEVARYKALTPGEKRAINNLTRSRVAEILKNREENLEEDIVDDRGRPTSEDDDDRGLYRKPNPKDYLAPNEQVEIDLKNVLREGARRGMTIKVGEATKALSEGGTYSPSKRVATLVMKNVLRPTRQNLLDTLHEVLHDVVAQAPDYVQHALHDIFARLPEAETAYYRRQDISDPRLAQGESAFGSREEYILERAVEHAAIHGIDAQFARGTLAAVWRTTKDLLLRGAMYLQEKLLGEGNVGGRLAKEWAENMAASIISGDRLVLDSFLTQFPPRPTWQSASRMVGASSGPMTPLRPQSTSEISFAAAQYRANAYVDSAIQQLMADGTIAAMDAQDELATIPGNEVVYKHVPARQIVSEQVQAGMRKAESDTRVATAVANQLHRMFTSLFERDQKINEPIERERILEARKRGESIPDEMTYARFTSLLGHPKLLEARDEGLATFKAMAEGHVGQKVKEQLIDPNLTIDQLNPVEQKLAELQLEAALTQVNASAARRMGNAQGVIMRTKDTAENNRAKIQEIVKNLADYRTTEKYAVRSIVGNLRDLLKYSLPKGQRLSEHVGMTQAILESLDEKNAELFDARFTQRIIDEIGVGKDDLQLASVFKALFEMEQAGGFSLSDISPKELRQKILDEVARNSATPLAKLVEVGEGPDAPIRGTALLSAVMSFVRQEANVAETIRMQLTDVENRNARVLELRDVINETSRDKLNSIRESVKTDLKRPRNRLLHSWLETMDNLKRDQRQLANAERERDLLKVSVPILEQAISRASSRLRVSHRITFTKGEPIFNPENADWTSKEVFEKPYVLQLSREKFETSEDLRSIARNQRAWMDRVEADPSIVPDEVYHTMKMQHEQLFLAAVDKKVNMLAGIKNGAFHSLSEMLIRTGTPAGRLAARRFNKFESIKRNELATDTRLGKKFEEAADAFIKASGRSPEWVRHAVYNQGLDYLNSERSLDLKSALSSLRQQFLENPLTRDIMKVDATWAKFVRWMEVTDENRLRRAEMADKLGIRVHDEKIQRRDPITGKLSVAERGLIERGTMTVGRGLSRRIKGVAAFMAGREKLLGDGPDSPFENLTYKLKMQTDDVRARLLDFFSQGEVMDTFLDPLMRNQKPVIPAPVTPDGLKITLSSAIAREMWAQSKGDLIAFADAVYQRLGASGSQQAMEEYRETVVRFVQNRLQALVRDANIGDNANSTAPRGLAHVAMDARVGEDYPWEWVEYHYFTVNDNAMQTHVIAANSAFGRDLTGIRGDFTAIMSDLDKIANSDSRWATPEGREALKKSDPKKYEQMETATRLRSAYGDGGLDAYLQNEFHPQGGVTGESMGLLMEIYGAAVSMMLTGLRTALKDLSSLTHPMQMEKSLSFQTLMRTGASFGYAGKNGLAMVLNGLLGTDLLRSDWKVRAQERAAGGDPARELTLKQLVSGERGKGDAFEKSSYGSVQRGLRIFRHLVSNQRLGFNEGASGPALRLNPFASFTQLQIFSATSAYMDAALDLAHRIAEFYQANPDKLGVSVTAKDIGYGDRAGFDNLRSLLADYGVSLESLGEKIAKKPGIKVEDILSDMDVQGIRSMVLGNIVGESGTDTRPALLRGSKFARANSVFVGWSFYKTAALMSLFRDSERNASVRTVLRGATTLGLGLMPMAVAMSLMLDWYDEELTDKKSNVRPLNLEGGLAGAAKSVMERSVMLGSFGLFGEVANGLLNSTDGAGQKALSVDQRIVWVNSTLQLLQSLNNFRAVGGLDNANYATVYRQMFSAIGGAGVLQNIQLINGLTGGIDAPLFRDEASVTARINVNNYLRAAGRDLQMDVRKQGQSSLPNASTPWVTKMILAALANDPDAFQEAYVAALKAAESVEGVSDPFRYVKDRFQSRHPLRAVFQTTPSTQEVGQILNRLDETGRNAVTQAITLMNTYGARLGVPPYLGSTDGISSRNIVRVMAKAQGLPAGQRNLASLRELVASRRSGEE